MKSVKINLNKIIKNPIDIGIIESAVNDANKLVLRTYDFIKLYVLHTLNEQKKLHQLSADNINIIFGLLSEKIKEKEVDVNAKLDQSAKNTFREFKKNYFDNIIPKDDVVDCSGLCQIRYSLSKEIETSIKNNITLNINNNIRRFINIWFEISQKIKQSKMMII